MSSRSSQAEAAFAFCLVISLLSVGACSGYQVFMYLKTGEWTEISVITMMAIFGSQWAAYPESWLGLYEVLDWFNAGVVIPLFIMPIAAVDLINS